MGKLAFNRLLNIQKCLLEIADLRMRTIAEQTLYTCGPCGCRANEFNFRCGFALCGAKKIFATPSTADWFVLVWFVKYMVTITKEFMYS